MLRRRVAVVRSTSPSVEAINRAYTRERVREAHRDVPSGLYRFGAAIATKGETDAAMRAMRALALSNPGMAIIKERKA